MNTGPLALLARALRGRVTRSLLTVGGVATTTLLVLVLLAAHRSLASGVNAYAGQPQIDLWVAPAGTDNLIRSSGLLPPDADVAIAALPGVAAADPLLRSFASVEPSEGRGGSRSRGEHRLTLLAIGYGAPRRLGGPPAIAEGRAPHQAAEVALDRAAAHRLRIGVGDSVQVNGRPAQVVGLTRGTNLLATQFVFSELEEARQSAGLPGGASFVAVRVTPGEDPAAVAQAIQARLPNVAVFDREAFVANNLREVASGLLPLLGLISGLGIGVAAVLVVLLVQGLVEDRRADIAVLFALGAGAATIGLGIIARAGVLVIAGGAIGILLVVALAGLLDRFVPNIELTYAAGEFVLVLVLFLAAGTLAAAIPVLRLRRIDPLEAFRA
jgi:putative ABC transport system permease protein